MKRLSFGFIVITIFLFLIFQYYRIYTKLDLYLNYLNGFENTKNLIYDFKNQNLENLQKDLIEKNENINNLKFIDVPKLNTKIEDNNVYNDVINRQQEPFGDSAGRHVNVHETAHGIHSDLRNFYSKKLGYRCNAFYCLKGRAVILREPDLTIKDVKKNIPYHLRSYRYNLYFVDQLKDWNDMPTYILDEWTAYILGSECALEDYKANIQIVKSDAVSGCLDFSIYSVALALTVKQQNPEYWNNNPEFKEFILFNLNKAEKIFNEGKNIFKSEKQENLLDNFLNNENSKLLKDFMEEEFGKIFFS